MSEMKEVLQAILELSNKMDSLDNRMGKLDSRMGKLEDRMSSLEDRVTTLEEQSKKNHEILVNKLDSLKEQMIVLAEDSITSRGDIRVLKKKAGILDY